MRARHLDNHAFKQQDTTNMEGAHEELAYLATGSYHEKIIGFKESCKQNEHQQNRNEYKRFIQVNAGIKTIKNKTKQKTAWSHLFEKKKKKRETFSTDFVSGRSPKFFKESMEIKTELWQLPHTHNDTPLHPAITPFALSQAVTPQSRQLAIELRGQKTSLRFT